MRLLHLLTAQSAEVLALLQFIELEALQALTPGLGAVEPGSPIP